MSDINEIEPANEQFLPSDPMITMIERIVLDPSADIAKLEKMLEMRERLEANSARRAFDRAIAIAKTNIPPILKTGTVDYTNKSGDRTYFKHDTLAGIAKIVDTILSAEGLSYRFRSDQRDGKLIVTCIVAHRDGHSEETSLQGSPDTSGSKNLYQALGSAVTYLQRYTLKLALGLSAASDDDGNQTQRAETISADQFFELNKLIEETDTNVGDFILAYGGTVGETPLEEFPEKHFAKAKAQLLRKKEKMA